MRGKVGNGGCLGWAAFLLSLALGNAAAAASDLRDLIACASYRSTALLI